MAKLKEGVIDPQMSELDQQMWDGTTLRDSVANHVIEVFNDWLDTHFPQTNISEMYYQGSTAGYQYTPESDIDIAVVVKGITARDLQDVWTLLPNGNNLPGTQHPVNYYVYPHGSMPAIDGSNGSAWDILNGGWLVEPKRVPGVVSNFRAVTEIARFFVLGVTAALQEYRMDVQAYNTYSAFQASTSVPESEKEGMSTLLRFKAQEVLADLDGLAVAYSMLHSLRKDAYTPDHRGGIQVRTRIQVSNSDTTVNNLIYKYVEKLGLTQEVLTALKDRETWEARIAN